MDPSNKLLSRERDILLLGCGFLGTQIALDALRDGYIVHALTRNPDQAKKLRALGVQQVIIADLDHNSWHDEMPNTSRAVINTVSSAGGGTEGYRKSYIAGQQSVMRFLARHVTDLYLYTSSVSVYPDTTGEWVTEDCVIDPGSITPAGKILLEGERIIEKKCPARSWTILRLAGIYGRNRHRFLDSLQAGFVKEENRAGSGLKSTLRNPLATEERHDSSADTRTTGFGNPDTCLEAGHSPDDKSTAGQPAALSSNLARTDQTIGSNRCHQNNPVKGEVIYRDEAYWQGYLNLIFDEDIVSAVKAILNKGANFPSGIYNLCDGHPAKRSEIGEWYIENHPKSGLKRPLSIVEKSRPPTTRSAYRTIGGKRPNRRISNSKIVEKTGWRPEFGDFRAGIRAIMKGRK